MMNETELDDRIGTVIQKALTEMKCMVLRAQHLYADIDALKANPTIEMVEAFCQKHDRLQAI